MDQRGKQKIDGLAMILAMALVGPAYAADPQDRQLTDDVQVSLVEVTVNVTRKGEPVRDLTAENFRLFDRGREVPIASLDVVDLSVEAMTEKGLLEPQLSIASRRHFLLLFDLAFSDPPSVNRAREAVRRWALDALHPWDLVGVSIYDEGRGAEVLLNFTTDREQVDLAIQSIGNPGFLVASGDPLGLEIGAVRSDFFIEADTARTGTKEDDASGPGGESALETMALIYYSVHEPLKRHGERHFVTNLTRSMEGLADMMAGVSGRKHVIYLSGGFDSSLVFASNRQQDIDYINQAGERGELWKIDQTKRFGSAVAQKDMSNMVDAFRRADCVIQAIDITGRRRLAADGTLSNSGTDALFYMAHETGGELLNNLENIEEAMTEILSRTSVTYILGFYPRNLRQDGKYHKLKVKLKDAPRGAELNHRPGYYAPVPWSAQSGITKRNRAAEALLSGEVRTDLDLTVLAAPFAPLAAPRAFVPVLLELKGASLIDQNEGDNLDLAIYVYAIAADGGIGDFITREVRFDLASFQEKIQGQGLKFYGDLALLPGDYSLRVLVQNRRTGAAGCQVFDLKVPGFHDKVPVLLPPLFPDIAGKWVLVHNSKDDGKPYPFVFGDRPFMPSASPRLTASSQFEVFLVGYNLDQDAGVLKAQLLDSGGTLVAEPVVQLLDLADPESDGREVLRVGLQLGAVKAGEYQLRFELGGGGAASQVARAPTLSLPLPVRIVPEAAGVDGGDLASAAARVK